MRDAFVVRHKDLLPMSLDNTRFGKPHVHLVYGDRKVDGWKIAKDGHREEVHETFATPLWDGNLWGVTFAAMSLQDGGHYMLPQYQYDSGRSVFVVTVQTQVMAPSAVSISAGASATGAASTTGAPHNPTTVPAWKLSAGTPEFMATYVVERGPQRMELSYVAGPQMQEPGGDCMAVR